MKKKIILSVFVFLSIACIAKGKDGMPVNDKALTLSANQADSFTFYYKKLERILEKNPYDTSSQCVAAVRYMENHTKIKAHPDGNYFGWFLFTKKDLIAWKEREEKNK